MTNDVFEEVLVLLQFFAEVRDCLGQGVQVVVGTQLVLLDVVHSLLHGHDLSGESVLSCLIKVWVVDWVNLDHY